MRPPPDLADKDALIATLLARIETLTAANGLLIARIAELESKLDQPPKTPDNSSVPPSRGQKASESSKPKPKSKPHAGSHRALHPHPTRRHPVFAFVIYLRSVQNIPLARLKDVLRDLLGLEISEGALVNILRASRKLFAKQTSLLKIRLLSGTALASDETGIRVGKANWWLWVFHDGDTAVFVVDPHRSKQVVESFLGEWRPDYWISDRLGSQTGWATKEQQFCLSHLIRDVQYAIDEGDAVLGPGLKGLLKRACAIGRRRECLADGTLKAYDADLNRRLDRLLSLTPTHRAGRKLQKTFREIRSHLFVFVTNRGLTATNNGSERALRPCAIYRKITNGFRSEWAATLYADVRSVIESGRRRCIRAIDAIRLTLQGAPLAA
jgi:hypothetical protein